MIYPKDIQGENSLGILGKAQGIFDSANSDLNVGSYLLKKDIKEFLCVDDSDLDFLTFKNFDGIEAIDEKKVRKAWYEGEIPNATDPGCSSLDELLILSIVRKALPNCFIERQVKVKRFKMDLKVTHEGQSIFIEFDGPDHFAIVRRPPKHEPFRKKKIVEDETGVEVVNWGYWIQRCESNVKVLFDKNIKGYGVLWSTNYHFGDFVFENSAEIIETINKRFNADRDGYGYFYGPNTAGRNNPEHPLIEKIRLGKKPIETILPKGFIDKEKWIPNQLKYLK